MSTSAILPISSIDFASTSATPSQKTVFSNLLTQLQQSIGNGDLTTSQTLLNALNALSPSSASSTGTLGAFLTSVNQALTDNNVSEAQSALTTYQDATPTTTPTTTSTTNTSATAAAIASNLVQSQLQLSLVTSLLASAPNSQAAATSSDTGNTLSGLLDAAYGKSGASESPSSSSSSASASSTSSTSSTDNIPSPYDTLLSTIQASLASGAGTIDPSLAYLQSSGNFVNTTA